MQKGTTTHGESRGPPHELLLARPHIERHPAVPRDPLRKAIAFRGSSRKSVIDSQVVERFGVLAILRGCRSLRKENKADASQEFYQEGTHLKAHRLCRIEGEAEGLVAEIGWFEACRLTLSAASARERPVLVASL